MIYERPRIEPSGDRAVRVAFGDERTLEVNRPVRELARLVEAAEPSGLGERIPSYATLTITYDPARTSYERLSAQIEVLARLALRQTGAEPPARLLRVPVCYEGEYAPDLDYICDHCGLSPKEVVGLHTSEPYYVFQLGFTPGCPFLGPLQEALHVPLMQTPRTSTPKGAVAVSVGQTVIYPRSTPGGMRVLGRTPVQLFQLDHPSLTLFKPGDRVQFRPVSDNEFRALEKTCLQLMDGVEVEDGGSRAAHR